MDKTAEDGERSLWGEAALAMAVFAVDPVSLGGAAIRARSGPVRDAWLDQLRSLFPIDTPFRKLPLHATSDRLLGSIDLAATLASGRPVMERGLLAATNGGVLVVPSAERMAPTLAAIVITAMDNFGVVALDEGEGDEEALPASLSERLAFRVDLMALGLRDIKSAERDVAQILAARQLLPQVEISLDAVSSICRAAQALGIASLRAPILAMRCARILAALDGRPEASKEDVGLAAIMVLAPRAVVMPNMEQSPNDNEEKPEPQADQQANGQDQEGDEENAPDDGPLTDAILAAVKASMPANALDRLMVQNPNGKASGGKVAGGKLIATRGRPAGMKRGAPRDGERLAIIDTLRAAAPWQRLRSRDIVNSSLPGMTLPSGGQSLEHRLKPGDDNIMRIEVRRDDLRVRRYKARAQTATIFLVDASGSTALQRLGEAKGAVELLLADCYIRRDQVALIAFRGREAQVLLPPTRSLTRAKRSLAALAGGGGTPLATALNAATALALSIRRKGAAPLIVLLTDGRANVAADGAGGRERAQSDAIAAGRQFRRFGIPALLIDTSPRPQATAEKLAREMAARYLPLPYADATALSAAARLVLPA